ncbi:MAG: GYF domain-containing protein [bacterium]
MKIVCDNCSAKYQISDDKVRNKTFKIRCKKCSHIIVVRGGEMDAAGDDSEPMVDEQRPGAAMADEPAPQPQGDPDAVWHVVINREQVGPLAPAQVEAYFRSGDLDAESFIWAEGMADWSRLASIPQFAHLAPPAPAAAPVAAAPVAAAAAAAPAAGGMFPSEDDDVIASNNVADATARAPSSMFPDEDEPANPRISTASQLRNQRNENSVLFSLDTLAAEADSRKARRSSSANTGGSEASGLIDITALSGLDAGSRGDDPFGSGLGMAPAPITAAAPIQPLVAPPSGNKTALIVAIVLGVLLLAGGVAAGMYFLMKKDGGEEPVAVAEPAETGKVTMGTPPPAAQPAAAAPAPAAAAAAEPEKAADGEGQADDTAGGDDEGKAGEDDKAEAAKAPAKRARARRATSPRRSAAAQADNEDDPPAAAPKPERQVQVTKRAAPARPKKESTDEVDALLGALDGSGGGSRAAASPGAAPAAAAAPAGDPMLPEKLSRQQILTVVKRNARSIQTCKAGTDASGTVPVEIVIGRSGRVESATVEGAHSGTPVGSCVERKVRAFRFPQFSGEPMRIKMPFSL